MLLRKIIDQNVLSWILSDKYFVSIYILHVYTHDLYVSNKNYNLCCTFYKCIKFSFLRFVEFSDNFFTYIN